MEPFATTWLAFVTMERTLIFCEFLNQTPLVNNDAVVNLPQLSVKSCLGRPLSLEETATGIVYTVGAMKKGKAAGPDGIRGRSIQGCWSSSY